VESANNEQLDLPIGESGAFRRMMNKIRRYAPFDDVPVLFEGETGTGKTILARFLHSLSGRADRPFEPIDLGTLDDGLAASALLGHTRGAYTGAISESLGPFATAHGGTVFLDEIENASAAVQRCLLRVTGEGELRPVGASRSVRVNVRLIAATNVPLASLLQERRLLPDLAARLSGCPVRVPPLREHAEDIPLLVRHFLLRFMGRVGYQEPPRIHSALMQTMLDDDWPENVRGLSRVVYRLLIEAAPAATITFEHCRDDLRYLIPGRAKAARRTPHEVRAAWREFGSAAKTARVLGISRATFYRLLHAGDRSRSPQEGPSLSD
jgi:DNA-binding NtrC family response regulator